MQIPPQVSFRGMRPAPAIEAACVHEAEKLDHYYDRITSCRVVVSEPHRHHRKGNLFSVRVDVTVPGAEFVTNREPTQHHQDEEIGVAIREAFDAIRRQIEDWVRKHRHQVKRHAPPPHGRIVSLFDDHGFIETPDGEQVYFHRNAVVAGDFDTLTVGDQLRFTEQVGEKGPQASSVRLVGRHHHLDS